MSYEDQIKAAKTPREAMLILARAVDELYAEQKAPVDPWASWGDNPLSPDEQLDERDEMEYRAAQQNPFEPVGGTVDEAEVQRLEAAVHAANDKLERMFKGGGDQLERMRAKEEVDSLTAKLRLAKDPGKLIPVSGFQVGDPEKFFQVEGVDLTRTPLQQPTELGAMAVRLPTPTEEWKQRRREMAELVDLPGFFPAVQRQTEEARQEIIENYVKGGPLWLYMGDEFGRNIVMQMPMDAKQIMLAEVASYGDVRVAHEFARDVMKDDGSGQDRSGQEADYLLDVADGAINDGHMTTNL